MKPFDIKKPLDMVERCTHCDLKYESEPGYWFGAMFISYIWTGFAALTIIGFCMMILKWGVTASFSLLIVIAAITYFFILRVSRSMYIHLDVKYDPSKIKKTDN